MEISAELSMKLQDEAIAICDALAEDFDLPVTMATYVTMTHRLIAVAKMALDDLELAERGRLTP